MSKSEDEGLRDSKYRYCFEVNTRGRGYLFCADTADELESWVDTFKQIINIDAAENLVSIGRITWLVFTGTNNVVNAWFRGWLIPQFKGS